jgi:hypothetical protein
MVGGLDGGPGARRHLGGNLTTDTQLAALAIEPPPRQRAGSLDSQKLREANTVFGGRFNPAGQRRR